MATFFFCYPPVTYPSVTLATHSGGGVTLSVNTLGGRPATGTRRAVRPAPTVNTARGVCRGDPAPIYVLSFLSICGFVTTLSGGVCGFGCFLFGASFALWGGWEIHIRVCMSNSVGLGMWLAPPTVHPERVGRRSQVFSRHLCLMICRSSRCLN